VTRSLGFWRTWGLVVGSAIGSAVFLVPALLAPYGLLSLAGWLVAALGMLAIAMSLGSLARRVPKIGGPYAYAREAFGDLAGFMVAWSYWISCWCGVAFISVAFSGYLSVFIPALAVSPAASATAAVAVLWLFTAINIGGVREAAALNLVLTLLKIVPLLVIGAAGLVVGDLASVPMPETGADDGDPSMLLMLGGMLVITMGAFVGLEAGTIPADDVLEPDKTIPRALIIGTLTIAAIYILATGGVMALVPSAELAKSASPFAAAALTAFGPVGEKIIAIGALISILGVLSATILLAGQMPRAAALDHLFPERFARLNPRGAPAFALLISSSLATVMLAMSYSEGAVAAFEFMFMISTLTAVVVYVICALADLVLQRRDAKTGKPFLLSSASVAAVAFITALVALLGSGVELLGYTAILLVAGLPVYWWSKRRRRPLGFKE
jgi:APA family basic amino acid/polyamine antiporter